MIDELVIIHNDPWYFFPQYRQPDHHEVKEAFKRGFFVTNLFGHRLVQCSLCCAPTAMTGTRHCDRCHELKTRITMDPELARRILRSIENKNRPEPEEWR
jgi:hypothetical protein